MANIPNPIPERCPKCGSKNVKKLVIGPGWICYHCSHSSRPDPGPGPLGAESNEPPPVGAAGLLYMGGDLDFLAVCYQQRGGPNMRISQFIKAGDAEVGGALTRVQTGVIVHGPDWSFRIGARTEDQNEEGTAPEPEWAITVVPRA